MSTKHLAQCPEQRKGFEMVATIVFHYFDLRSPNNCYVYQELLFSTILVIVLQLDLGTSNNIHHKLIHAYAESLVPTEVLSHLGHALPLP